ncbi:SH3 domain-containing protein [Patescibacteria group bacterium]|nr:SH3 domain-containing protein [Patescibacteria group bacterium]
MRKIRIIVLVLLGIVLVVSLIFFLVGVLRPQVAGLLIETDPSATVFIDGVQVGRTPYKETRKPEELVVKLVPDSFERPLAPYETRVNLVSGVETVIKWQFGESEDMSEGEIVSFEKVGREETSLSVVTIPDASQVAIDGAVRAFAPYKTSTISPGEHTLVISANGYGQRNIKLRTHSGYKLTAVVKLSKSEEVLAAEESSDDAQGKEEEEKPTIEVEIQPTGVGFLRVRSEPSTLAEEVARVTPGETYLFIEEDEETGWFKIEYLPAGEAGEEEEQGWISNQYAEIVEEEFSEGESPTSTPTETPSETPQPSP